jgi:hypothetical protein
MRSTATVALVSSLTMLAEVVIATPIAVAQGANAQGAAVSSEGPAAEQDGSARGIQTLTVTADTSETERGINDTGPTGLSKADTYVSNAKLRDLAGNLVGTYHVACTITDEEDENGSAWSLCQTAATIDGRGTLLASALTELLDVQTSPGGFGVAPPTAEFAIVGGTGAYAGAIGQVTETRDASIRKLNYRFVLSPILSRRLQTSQ